MSSDFNLFMGGNGSFLCQNFFEKVFFYEEEKLRKIEKSKLTKLDSIVRF